MLILFFVCSNTKDDLLDRTETGIGQLKIFPKPFGVVLFTMPYSLSHAVHPHPEQRDSQKAALPIFVAVCPPVLYSGTLTKLRV